MSGHGAQDREVKLVSVGTLDIQSLMEIVAAEQDRTARQIASLEAVVAAIIDGSELVSTDDEHDPEGATIAYERAQASALCDKRVRTATHSSTRADSSNWASGWSVRCAAMTSTSSASPRCRPPLVASCAPPDHRRRARATLQPNAIGGM